VAALSPHLEVDGVRATVTAVVAWCLAEARSQRDPNSVRALRRRLDDRRAWPRLCDALDERGLLRDVTRDAAPAPRQAVLEAVDELTRPGENAIDYANLDVEHLGAVHETLLGISRRDTGSHYTPRGLTTEIVHGTLAPLLEAMGPEPSAAQIAELTVCDPAMGSGAFLLETCRQLSTHLAAAWSRESGARGDADPNALQRARSQVARSCLIGVDKDPEAVHLARVSLQLLALSEESPPHRESGSLFFGDALVGVTKEQLRAFSITGGPPQATSSELLDAALSGRAPAQLAEWLGDLLVSVWFAGRTKRERRERGGDALRRLQKWQKRGDARWPPKLAAPRDAVRSQIAPFHWQLSLSERKIDAVVGNPPFLGGKRISTVHGVAYANWLAKLHGTSKNADLSAHFFRRAAGLLEGRGTIGLIATNTIAQGDTRGAGLAWLLANGFEIYDATRSRPWPGRAKVSVSVVHLSQDLPVAKSRMLGGQLVSHIDSRLRARPEREAPAALADNRGSGFVGCFLRGNGFIATSALRDQWIRLNPKNAEIVRPYIGGEEVNSSPTQAFHRYVVDFADRELAEAQRYPELLEALRLRVKPSRDRLRDEGADLHHKRLWWRFANTRPELRSALRGRSRCLVTARVTKHLCFAFQPTGRVFSEQLLVFAFDDYARFAVLESRVHDVWARLLSSSFGEGLRYTPSEAFETFPFPNLETPQNARSLTAIGERLHQARAAFVIERKIGLTAMRNRVADPFCADTEAIALRHLYEDLDRSVLAAYGWPDIAVPPYSAPTSSIAQGDFEVYEDAVIARLFALNAERMAVPRKLARGQP